MIFVTQPLNAISPIDQKFFELIVPIATFLTGTLSGIMLAGNDKDAQKAALQAANKGWERPPTPVVVSNPAPVQAATQVATVAAPAFVPQVVTGFGGKEAPAQPPHPEI